MLILAIVVPNISVGQEYVNASTQFTICFDVQHTYVSDLGFYLIGPQECNSPVVSLAPFAYSLDPANGCCCNSGNNIDSLCFTTSGSAFFEMCSATIPLTGNFIGYDSVSGPTVIDWSPLYGCPVISGSWRAQVFDCIGSDVGTFVGGTLYVDGQNEDYFYHLADQNSPINDNSCTPESASIIQFGTDEIIVTSTPNELSSQAEIRYEPQNNIFRFSGVEDSNAVFKIIEITGRTIFESRVGSDLLAITPTFNGVLLAALFGEKGELLSSYKIVVP